MYVFDRRSLKFLEVNAAAIQQYGYTRDEFLRMSTTDIRPPDDVPLFLEALRRTSGTTLVSQGHWRHRKKNGDAFIVEVTTHSIPFAGCNGILATAQDVTPRRAAEQKAAEHDVYLQALLLNLPLAVMILDAGRRIRMCNPAFEKLFGYKLSEVAGREPQSILAPPDRVSESVDIIQRVMAGETIRSKTKRKRSDGRLVDVQTLAIPLILNGETVGCVGIYEDISERAEAENAQRRAEEKFKSLFENAVEGIF